MDLTSVLRLEVEDTTTAPVNLVRNPSGDLGGWGWVTPLAGAVLAGVKFGGLPALELTTAAGDNTFYTERYAVTPGQYVAASVNLLALGSGIGAVSVGVTFLDANGAFVSGTGAGVYQTAAAIATRAPVVVPAGAAYARLYITPYQSAAGPTNPAAGKKLTFRDAALAKAATAAPLTTVRTNLILNPSFETNITGWAADPGFTPTGVSQGTVPWEGSKSLKVNGIGTLRVRGAAVNVTAGKDYVFKIMGRAATGGTQVSAELDFFNAAGDLLATIAGPAASDGGGAYKAFGVLATAPVGATTARPCVRFSPGHIGEDHHLDLAFLEQTSLPVAQVRAFTGATTSSSVYAYAWNGTAHASTSKETSADLSGMVNTPYRNIIGPSTSIRINRYPLDAGVLTAVVRDTSLDPAGADLLRTGRAVRVTALNATNGLWEPLFTGELYKPVVSYDLERTDSKQATITITAYDPNQALANVKRANGVGTAAELPYLLEGAGVPWDINGSGNQVAAAALVSKNDNASALDQVALTRDSVSAYAWMDRYGVLNVYSDRAADYYGNGTATLDESRYSKLETSFDPDQSVNEVLVTYLRFNASTGETVEVPYGPYRDEASIQQWGVHQETYRVHGILEANIPAYAAAILAANKTPALRVSSMTVPIRSAADLTWDKALIDLYTKAQVTNAAKGINLSLRVSSIEHDITPQRWRLNLGFGAVSSVAAPASTPELPVGAAVTEGVWTALNLAGAWTNFGGTFGTARYMRKNGIVYLTGMVKGGADGSTIATLPAGFRPAADFTVNGVINSRSTSLPDAGTAHRHTLGMAAARLNITAAGGIVFPTQPQPVDGTTYLSIAGISFPAEA